MDFSATYHLEGTTLTISYHATSDKDTLINITNHSYFNLSGHKHNIYNHTLKIDADYYEHVDADGLATGEKEAVEGTPFDFRIPAKIGERVEVDHPQLKLGNGFDHNFFFTTDKNQVVLEDEESGRRLTVSTTLPGAQIYTANYLDGRIGKNGEPYNARDAVCIETQNLPDAIHIEKNPSTILRKGETFDAQTSYCLEVIK